VPKAEPVLVFHWYRPEDLPSQQEERRRYAAWRKRPKERHHIFPQALQRYFTSRGINIHEWTLVMDAAEHARIHKEADRGPWNTEWKDWIQRTGGQATKPMHFEHASFLIRKYNLFGIPATYWQTVELPPLPPP
jgi:hypothetical protein